MDSDLAIVASGLPCLFPILFFGLFIAIYLLANAYEQKKIKRFMSFALAHGLNFRANLSIGGGWFEQLFSSNQGASQFLLDYQGFKPITQSSPTLKYIFDGTTKELEFQAFQYQYTTGSGKNRQTHYFSLACARLPLWVPAIEVDREDFFDQVGKFFGGQDIHLESHEFNELFRVTGADERVAHNILHPQMMEWFIHVQPPGFQIQQNKVVLWRSGSIDENFVMDTRAMLGQFWELVPDYVKEDLR